MGGRLPAALEVSGLVRAVQAEGGFATVVAKGEADAGTILLVLLERGRDARLYERMPLLSGERAWQCTRRDDPENPGGLDEFLRRRRAQDPDVWIVELDIPQAERFIGPTIAPG
jgi:hypothetical protein